MIKKSLILAATLGTVINSTQATELEVTITNLTHGIAFTPILVASHGDNYKLFTAGTAASTALQKMAEGGATDDLQAELTTAGATFADTPIDSFTTAGMSQTVDIDTGSYNQLSITGMLLPTNDGFVALNGWDIPADAQAGDTYTLNLNAYDAGTEANDELLVGMPGGAPGAAGIPGDPSGASGTNGTGVNASIETQVHIHRGVLGDTNATGGSSDLDSTVHRWLNPVARVTVTVK